MNPDPPRHDQTTSTRPACPVCGGQLVEIKQLWLGESMFRVEFALHVFYDKGIAQFDREEQLPFAPLIGLDVLDDGLGQFKLEHVAWHSGSQMFLCQATVKREHQSLREVQRSLKKAGWTEDKEAREPHPRP